MKNHLIFSTTLLFHIGFLVRRRLFQVLHLFRKPLCVLNIILLSYTLLISQESFINSNGEVQYYITDKALGLTVIARPYFEITRQNDIIIVMRSGDAYLPPIIRFVIPVKNTSIDKIRESLMTTLKFDGIILNSTSKLENLGVNKLGVYVEGKMNGVAISGYMIGMLGQHGVGVFVINLQDKQNFDTNSLLKTGALDQAGTIAFSKPGGN